MTTPTTYCGRLWQQFHCYHSPDHEFKAPILDKRHDLKFPTNIVVSVDGKLLVSEYLSGDIKVFGTQEMIDDIANEADDELPPAYDALGASAPLVNPIAVPQAVVSEDASLENNYLKLTMKIILLCNIFTLLTYR